MSPLTLEITDVETLQGLPNDPILAAAVAQEILRNAVAIQHQPAQEKLENRPDWQRKIQHAREQIARGEVISDEDHLEWKRRQRE